LYKIFYYLVYKQLILDRTAKILRDVT